MLSPNWINCLHPYLPPNLGFCIVQCYCSLSLRPQVMIREIGRGGSCRKRLGPACPPKVFHQKSSVLSAVASASPILRTQWLFGQRLPERLDNLWPLFLSHECKELIFSWNTAFGLPGVQYSLESWTYAQGKDIATQDRCPLGNNVNNI